MNNWINLIHSDSQNLSQLNIHESKFRRRDTDRHCSRFGTMCGGLVTSQNTETKVYVFNSFPVFISQGKFMLAGRLQDFWVSSCLMDPMRSERRNEKWPRTVPPKPGSWERFVGTLRGGSGRGEAFAIAGSDGCLDDAAMYRLQVYVVECVSPHVCLA